LSADWPVVSGYLSEALMFSGELAVELAETWNTTKIHFNLGGFTPKVCSKVAASSKAGL
jgi:hypothetical protein